MKIGVLGGGQLGRMMALAGYPLGLEFVFYDRNPQACAADVGSLVVGEFDDSELLTSFAQQVDVVTVEFENIPGSALEHVSQFVPVYPSPRALGAVQDRLDEKRLFQSLDIPTPVFYAVENAKSLADTFNTHKDTLILKSRRFGYDGKGQMQLQSADEADEAWKALGGVPLIAEQRIPFQREVSIIAARGHDGKTSVYPLAINLHKQGILRRSEISIADPLQDKAEDYVQRVLQELDYVGVLAFEFFVCNGELLANEVAPRVHNSGHWTIEGAVTSQFENHLRAILDWPLGDTSARDRCVMYNVIGEMPDKKNMLKVPGLHFHDYAKEPRAGRKIGHVTLCDCLEQNEKIIENMPGIQH